MSLSFCNYAPPRMFLLREILFEYWIEHGMLPSGSFLSCLDSLLEYSTGEFQALQLIVHAVFAALD